MAKQRSKYDTIENYPFRLKTDKDELLSTKEDAYYLENVRIEQKDSFYLVNLTEEKVGFTLSDGFKSIAIASYNQIYFIFSLNPTTDELEVGSYPSPDYNGNLVDQYQPLKTYVGSQNYFNQSICDYDVNVTRQDFRIANFGLSLKRHELHCYDFTDGSINLLLLSESGNVVFNSGFSADGIIKKGYFNDSDILEKTYLQLNEFVCPPNVSPSIESNGSLQTGSYEFYIRYKKLNGSTTSFKKITNQVNVFDGQVHDVTDVFRVFSSEGEQTNKSILLELSQNNPAYEFFEIGVIYRSGANKNITLAYKVNQLFNNEQVTFDISIKGNNFLPIDVSEILSSKIIEKGCLTGDFVKGMFFGGNWFNQNFNNSDLCEYAKLVQIGEELVNVASDDYTNDLTSHTGAYGVGDKDRGYFSGETYCFMLHPVFKDGSIGLGFPMKGRDNLDGLGTGATNEKGIYRFSSKQSIPFFNGTDLFSKYPTFDFTDANLNAKTTWIEDNVKGWHISRTKRNKNMLYQGILYNCYNGDFRHTVINDPDKMKVGKSYPYDVANLDIYENHDKYFPLIEPKSFYFASYKDSVFTIPNFRKIMYGFDDGTDNHQTPTGKYALFSTDFMIDEQIGEIDLSSAFIQKIAVTNLDPKSFGNFVASNTNLKGHYQDSYISFQSNPTVVETYSVTPWSGIENNEFCSKLDVGGIETGWHYGYDESTGGNAPEGYIFNLGMACPAYIGIESDDDLTHYVNDFVAIYKRNPVGLNIEDEYSTSGELFGIISKIVLLGEDNTSCGGGDCYVQRNTIKTIHATGHDATTLEFFAPSLTSGKDDIGFGLFLSFVSENKHNSYGRIPKGGNSFYAHKSIEDFLGQFNLPESFFYNRGYDFELIQNFTTYDARLNLSQNNLRNSIAYTLRQKSEGIEDAYRSILGGQIKTFNLNDGKIVKLLEQNGNLITIHENAIHGHPVNERIAVSEESKLSIGYGEILPEQTQKISRYGTQYLFGACKDDQKRIYGIDVNNQVIWRLGQGFELLSKVKMCQKEVHYLIFGNNIDERYQKVILDGYETDFVNLYFDHRFDEVLFTIHNHTLRSLAFSTLSDEFVGRRTDIELQAINELRSYDLNEFMLPDFSDYRKDFVIGIVVTNKINYQYHSHHLLSVQNDLGLKEVLFSTDNQSEILTVATAPSWYKPQFRNKIWFVPIPRSTALGSTHQVKSVMTGDYMKSLFIFEKIGKLELKGILTKVLNNFR
ncbi:MAG: hypothetical protein AB8G11_02435 [Saprospiraceae bacterium]